ncbi:hypothetical protein FGB62_43g120 [Gracilaria domingensis]|nr:hypothetical protein FGB62_43g120 [Gracilaria domingensis]
MFRPLSWDQNEKLSLEQKQVDESTPLGTSLRDSGANLKEMLKSGDESLKGPKRVKPVSITPALKTPKLLKPIPVANKVLISFEDVEDVSDSQEFTGRSLGDCSISLSPGSGLSAQNEDAALPFSPRSQERAYAIRNGIFNPSHRTSPKGSGNDKRDDVTSEEFDQLPFRDDQLKPNQVRVQDFRGKGIQKIGAIGESRGEPFLGKPFQVRRASFFGPDDVENIPPASIISIESPSISYRAHSIKSKPETPIEDTKPFATPPTHFRSSNGDGSSDSRASESLSSAASSRGDDSTRSRSFSSLKSSDEHPARTRGPGSVSSSSSFKSDDVSAKGLESTQKYDRRRRSREQSRVLRIFDRRQSSTDTRDIIDNPWFQAMAIENDLQDLTGTSRPAKYPRNVEQKGKRTKISKLGRSLKNQGKRKKLDNESNANPASHDKKSIPTSTSNTPLDPSSGSKDIANEELRHVLRRALSGRRHLDDVLECMMRVYTRPSDNVLQLMHKYFGSTKTIEAGVKWITEELRVLQGDMSEKRRSKETEAYIVVSRIYREILLQIFTTGPDTVKKAFLSSSKACSALIRFLEKDVPQGRLELKAWAKTSVSIFKILNGLMKDHVSDVVLFISSKEGLLRSIVSKHICFPEVVSFVSKLCSSDALSETTEDIPRYGPPNPHGILLLAKENVIDVLAHVFIDSCDARSANSCDLVLDRQRNSLQCIKDISFKAVTIPKFGKTNCSMNAKQIRMLNTALDSIALYSATDHVQAGIEYSIRRINGSENGKGEVLSSRFEQNYPLIHILSLSTDLLDVVLRASESKKIAVRRTIGMVNTEKIEGVVLSNLDALCGFLGRNSTPGIVSTTELSIIELLRCLFASEHDNVWVSLSNKRVPELLLAVVEDNELRTLIHKAVIECLEASLKRKEAVALHKQWVTCIGKSDAWRSAMRAITEEKQSGEHCKQKQGSQIQCTYVQITSALMDLANSVHSMNLSSFLTKHGVTAPFMERLEVNITRRREEQNIPCGGPKPEAPTISVLACAEFLAAHLNDVNAV